MDTDKSGCNGWYVRIKRQKKLMSKYFFDNHYKDRYEALKEAVKFRDEVLRKSPPALRGGCRNGLPYSLPSPGTLNRKVMTYKARDGEWYEYEAWVAWIRISPNKMCATKWSIDSWGVRVAKERCEEWLKEKRVIQEKNYALEKKKFMVQQNRAT